MELNNEEINSLFKDAIKSINELISIPSYADESLATVGNPYGENVHQALNYVINLGKKMGFKTFIGKEKRYGYIEYGTGNELVGILCHLDVVPPGDLSKWKYDPFTPTIENNILYGRGVIDDKGPAIINLYALKYLVDKKITFQKRIRLIFGLTEETTWDSINHYLENEEKPTIAYTPDGYFPVVYAEKTILNLDIIEKNPQQKYVIKAGQAYNVTCDEAKYYGNETEQLIVELAKNNFDYEISSEGLTVKGKAAHGSKPQDGINAGIRLLTAISNFNEDSKLALWIKEVLGEDVHAYKVFDHIEDESGSLTFNVGYVEMDANKNWIGCDLRIPVHSEVTDIINKLRISIAPYNLTLEQKDLKKKLFFDQKSPLVKTLLDVYEKVTGHRPSPIAIGGGTYARSIENCLAFGAIFNGHTSTEHQYNENVKVEELKLAMKIYIEAIIALDRL